MIFHLHVASKDLLQAMTEGLAVIVPSDYTSG